VKLGRGTNASAVPDEAWAEEKQPTAIVELGAGPLPLTKQHAHRAATPQSTVAMSANDPQE
jgi:hypothetical protein